MQKNLPLGCKNVVNRQKLVKIPFYPFRDHRDTRVPNLILAYKIVKYRPVKQVFVPKYSSILSLTV